MSDLDLDAIRARIGKADKVYGDTLDCTEDHTDDHEAGLLNAMYVVIHHSRELLAEVERLRDINQKLALTIRACPEGHHDANLAHARAERDQLRAEVERLKANQQPDDGAWEVQYRHRWDSGKVSNDWESATQNPAFTDPEAVAMCVNNGCEQRSVWIGPAEPLSKPSDTPPESTTDQTAPQTP